MDTQLEPDVLTSRINGEHGAALKGMADAVIHGWRCGALLKEKKEQIDHGGWLPWLVDNFDGSIRQAQVYMQIHTDYPDLPNTQTSAHLSIKGLLALTRNHLLDSTSPDWHTPKEYVDSVYKVMGRIDLDPASCAEANEVIQAGNYFTKDDDGLGKQWHGRVFLNPPYGKGVPAFAAKLYDSLGSGVEEAILLVNSRATDADWFQPCFNGIICFTDHRIDFDSPNEKETSSTHGSCFVYFGPHEKEFIDEFSRHGNVVRRA